MNFVTPPPLFTDCGTRFALACSGKLSVRLTSARRFVGLRLETKLLGHDDIYFYGTNHYLR
ncbi:MAG: hypothetical protein MSG64_13725 [Pyrinomonadaceae bacterium MAG19_C2-C3]|nr:hypothetical protein [Pyrinomonadaceae bacterium MAG19_C2-C3]